MTKYTKAKLKDIKNLKDSSNGLLLEGLSSWGEELQNKTLHSCLLKKVVAESAHVENNAWSKTVGEDLNLRESVVVDSIFSHCLLPNTNFEACAFEGVSFYKSILRGSNFRGASFEGCTFEGANLENVDFRGADLSGCNLYDCQSLVGAIFDKTTVLPFSPLKAKELGMVQNAVKLVVAKPVVSSPESPNSTSENNVIDFVAYKKQRQLNS